MSAATQTKKNREKAQTDKAERETTENLKISISTLQIHLTSGINVHRRTAV